MMSLRIAASRIPASRITTLMPSRALSSQTTNSLQKLRSVLEEYRQENYTRELPTRFKKDVVRAAAKSSASDQVALDGMQRVLANIGAEHRMTFSEMKAIFEELGNETGEIPVQRMVQIL